MIDHIDLTVNQLGDLYYSSKANYVHLGEDKDFDEMYRKEIWRGQSNLQSLKGRQISLREIPSFVIPIGILLLLIVFGIALISGYPGFALVALSLAVAPLILYTLRLYRIARNTTSFADVLKFYLYYFPARALGTLGGIFRTIGNTSHNK